MLEPNVAALQASTLPSSRSPWRSAVTRGELSQSSARNRIRPLTLLIAWPAARVPKRPRHRGAADQRDENRALDVTSEEMHRTL